MSVEFTIVSIGALSHHRLWGEAAPTRTAHATTTLVTAGDRLILVDPGLPASVLTARLFERTGKGPADITDVLCTTLRPAHRRGIDAFGSARWLAHEVELESYRGFLENTLESAERLESDEVRAVREDLDKMDAFQPAEEQPADQVTLYPLAGPTPGSAGLLLTPPTQTIVIAGDAALTSEHIQSGQIWQGCLQADRAMESLRDLLELADVIVPGHDNVVFSPRRWL